MRLLDKQSIVQQKSSERKREIDEGVKLAKKVDLLREVSAVEEAKLNKIRVESTALIKSELVELSEKKNVLQDQIESLEIKRASLQKPLDDEWAFLKMNQGVFEQDKNSFAVLVADLSKSKQEHEERKKELVLDEERIATTKVETDFLIREAVQKSTKAQAILEAGREEVDKILTRATHREQEVIDRELELAGKERAILHHKELLGKRERDLDIRERAITDKYDTLQRTIKRLKQ